MSSLRFIPTPLEPAVRQLRLSLPAHLPGPASLRSILPARTPLFNPHGECGFSVVPVILLLPAWICRYYLSGVSREHGANPRNERCLKQVRIPSGLYGALQIRTLPGPFGAANHPW